MARNVAYPTSLGMILKRLDHLRCALWRSHRIASRRNARAPSPRDTGGPVGSDNGRATVTLDCGQDDGSRARLEERL